MLAIIYTIVLLWIFFKSTNAQKILYQISFVFLFFGIAMFGYGKLFLRIPIAQATFGLLNSDKYMETQWLFMVVPFYMMGYGLRKKNMDTTKAYRKCEILVLVTFVTYIVEVAMLQIFDVMQNAILCLATYPLVFLLMILAIKHPMLVSEKTARYAKGIASFMYFSHNLFVFLFQRIGFSETPTYLVTVVITAVFGGLIVKMNNPFLNKLL